MRVADHIAKTIADQGVTHAFGIIGAGNVALFDAIARLGETEIVCVHHEQAAVMAATAYGRTSGRTGVAVVTTGAGSANAITGALAAHMDSCPVVIISGNEPSKYMDSEARVIGVQGYHTSRVAQFISKSAWKVSGGANAIAGIKYSFEESTSGRPGPIWIDIPRDYFNAVV